MMDRLCECWCKKGKFIISWSELSSDFGVSSSVEDEVIAKEAFAFALSADNEAAFIAFMAEETIK
jgi:hypothetical protein